MTGFDLADKLRESIHSLEFLLIYEVDEGKKANYRQLLEERRKELAEIMPNAKAAGA